MASSEDRFAADRIAALYGHYGSDRIHMYRKLGNRAADDAQRLAQQSQFRSANEMADLAREFREAADFLATRDLAAGI